jgi:lipoprotein-anchoring transpeptidase ErfK/SrfK
MMHPLRYIPILLTLMLYGASGSTAQPAPAAGAESVTGLTLEVSLAERVLTVRSGEEVLATYDVAVGKDTHATPTGTFHIRRVIWNPSWTPPNAPWARGKKPKKPGDPNNPMGRVKIFFAEPDYFIHGTNQEESIGSAASHGCIRMRNDDAIALAKLVMENGGADKPPNWFRRIINRVTDTEEVRLSSPVAIRIEQTAAVAAAN